MKLKIICVLSILTLVTICGCAKQSPADQGIKSAIRAVLYPAIPPERAKEEIPPRLQGSLIDANLLRELMGSRNLTYRILTLPMNAIDETYAFTFESPNLDKAIAKIKATGTLITLDDLHDLTWKLDGDSAATGSFTVDTDYGLTADFLFLARRHNRDWQVTRLVIARDNSRSIDDGYNVFFDE